MVGKYGCTNGDGWGIPPYLEIGQEAFSSVIGICFGYPGGFCFWQKEMCSVFGVASGISLV